MTTRKNQHVRKFILNAFLGLPNDDAELLAIFQDKLYELIQIIRQRSPELYDEIIRHYTDTTSSEKLKIELNRARRNRN